MIEYMADNNEMLIQILQKLNNFQLQTTAAFSEVRAEIKKSREIENEHWQENLRRWDENDKAAGWTRQINVTADGDPDREALAFKKALLLEVLNLTIPGVPCIYQGDEYGQCGANDPDNRRMMRFSGLTDNEKRMRNEVNALIRFRRQSMPLLYGDYVERFCNDSVLLFTRTYMGETVVVGINNSDKE